LSISSCNNPPAKTHGPIVLGDSATIVTEHDPKKLEDLVTDLNPQIPPSTPAPDTAKKVPAAGADTAKPAVAAVNPPQAAAPVSGPALKAEFKETTVTITGIDVKIAGKADLQKANGAVYTLNDKDFNAKNLLATGNVTKVSQRYQSIVILHSKMGDLPLDALTETTDWEPVKGSNGQYPVAGLDEHSLEYATANSGSIRNAVSKACQRRHYSRKKMQEYLSLVSGVRAANQKPLQVTLRSIMWKVDGKDAQGHLFSKQLRVDVPM